MNEFLPVLHACPLFQGIDTPNLQAMLGCLGASVRRYEREQAILPAGEPAKYLGIVLSGQVRIVHGDYLGNRSILSSVEPGQLFGESFAFAGTESLPVEAVAAGDAAVMLLDARCLTTTCSSACGFHNQLIFNLLRVVSEKNLIFHRKLEVTSKRTTRERLMTYLLQQAERAHSTRFTIPFDRQALADYLEVDRSGLSAEIGRLRREGVLDCRRSDFTLLRQL